MSSNASILDLFVLDVETVPAFAEFNQLSDEWRLLWKEKISKTVPETIPPEDSYSQRAGILAEFGKIICISTGYFLEDHQKELCFRIKSLYSDDETSILHAFKNMVEKLQKHNRQFQFAGHNIREFDIPYICRRMLIKNISLPYCLQLHGAKPWEVNIVDTLQWWKFGDYKNYVSLNLLAQVLGIPTSKTDIDGSMVQHVYYKDKNLMRIVDYCQRDVIVTANILLRFNNIPVLNTDNIQFVQ